MWIQYLELQALQCRMQRGSASTAKVIIGCLELNVDAPAQTILQLRDNNIRLREEESTLKATPPSSPDGSHLLRKSSIPSQ